MKLHPHHLAELLEAVHELLVVAVLEHRFLRVSLEHVNGFHVLGVGKQFADLLIRGDAAEEVLSHPFVASRVQVVVHLHGLLDLRDS